MTPEKRDDLADRLGASTRRPAPKVRGPLDLLALARWWRTGREADRG